MKVIKIKNDVMYFSYHTNVGIDVKILLKHNTSIKMLKLCYSSYISTVYKIALKEMTCPDKKMTSGKILLVHLDSV